MFPRLRGRFPQRRRAAAPQRPGRPRRRRFYEWSFCEWARRVRAGSAVNGARRAAAARRPPGGASQPITARRRLTRPQRAGSAGGGGRGGARVPRGGAQNPQNPPKTPKIPVLRPFLIRDCTGRAQGRGPAEAGAAMPPWLPGRLQGKGRLAQRSLPSARLRPRGIPSGIAGAAGSQGSETGLFYSLRISGPSLLSEKIRARVSSAPCGAPTPGAGKFSTAELGPGEETWHEGLAPSRLRRFLSLDLPCWVHLPHARSAAASFSAGARGCASAAGGRGEAVLPLPCPRQAERMANLITAIPWFYLVCESWC